MPNSPDRYSDDLEKDLESEEEVDEETQRCYIQWLVDVLDLSGQYIELAYFSLESLEDPKKDVYTFGIWHDGEIAEADLQEARGEIDDKFPIIEVEEIRTSGRSIIAVAIPKDSLESRVIN